MALRYDYSPLSEEARQIRLLTLLPDQSDAPIRITVQIRRLAKEIEFEALSYVWGSPSDPQEIFVETKKPKNWKLWHSTRFRLTTLPITRNLFEALQHLRLKDRPRVLWIDAVCVDQQNLEERGRQVLRMPDIYTQAKHVVLWLGPESYNSTLAMKAIDDIGSKIAVDWGLDRIRTTSANGSDPTSKAFLDDLRRWPEIWLAFRDLLDRPYFRRLWVLQEIYLAKERAQIVCGSQQTSPERFFNAVCYISKYSRTPALSELAVNVRRLGRICKSQNGILESLMNTTRYCHCFDERDRVYALLSLVPEGRRYGIRPSYTKTVLEVFQEVVLKRSVASARLDVLRQCSIDDRMLHLPTWVPNFSKRLKAAKLPLGSADLGARAHMQCGSKGTLTATGVCVTAVHDIKVNLPRLVPETRDEAASTIRELISVLNSCDGSNNRLSNLQSLCRALCANSYRERYIPLDDSWPNFKEAQKYIVEVDSWSLNASAEPPELYLPYLPTINAMLKGRFLIITTDGRLGLAPEAAKPGDKVCVLLGCEVSLLLRPDGNANYLVVGECYVDGITNGEPLLGELPKDWELVWKFSSQYYGHQRVYFDSNTSETHLQDPRLGLIPAGWRLQRHKEMDVYNQYKNERTGEVTVWDPRLGPDALRERGVQLQEFQLV